MRRCFPAGRALRAAARALLCRGGRPAWLAGLCGLLGALFLLLLVRTLFFAFPAEEAYARQDTGRPACTRGVYALCRHPGVLWLAGLCLCLWGGFGLPFFTVILVTALNLGLVAFEDCRVFPARRLCPQPPPGEAGGLRRLPAKNTIFDPHGGEHPGHGAGPAGEKESSGVKGHAL